MSAIDFMQERLEGYPELLADLADQVGTKLVEAGIPAEQAADIGFNVAEYMRTHWSGQSLYFPKGVEFEHQKKDMEIFEKFNGRNHRQLAKEYNLSVIRIYQIVKAVRQELIAKRQGALF